MQSPDALFSCFPFVYAWLSETHVDSHISVDNARVCNQHSKLLLCQSKVVKHCLKATASLLFPAQQPIGIMPAKYIVLRMAVPHIFPRAVLGKFAGITKPCTAQPMPTQHMQDVPGLQQ